MLFIMISNVSEINRLRTILTRRRKLLFNILTFASKYYLMDFVCTNFKGLLRIDGASGRGVMQQYKK